jgi:hypothetical protein
VTHCSRDRREYVGQSDVLRSRVGVKVTDHLVDPPQVTDERPADPRSAASARDDEVLEPVPVGAVRTGEEKRGSAMDDYGPWDD